MVLNIDFLFCLGTRIVSKIVEMLCFEQIASSSAETSEKEEFIQSKKKKRKKNLNLIFSSHTRH